MDLNIHILFLFYFFFLMFISNLVNNNFKVVTITTNNYVNKFTWILMSAASLFFLYHSVSVCVCVSLCHTLSSTHVICLNCRKQLSYACVNLAVNFCFYATRLNNPNKYVDDLWHEKINFCRSSQFFVTILKRSISVHSKSDTYYFVIVVVGLVVWHSWCLQPRELCIAPRA